MNFQPKTESEVSAVNLIADGEYDFEVLEAADTVSKQGNDMINLKLGVFVKVGTMRFVWDYIMPSIEYKLRHFCDSVGLLSKYENGSLTADDCIGRSGRCKVVIEKDKGGFYPDKNKVKDYCLRRAKPLNQATQAGDVAAGLPPDEDLPF